MRAEEALAALRRAGLTTAALHAWLSDATEETRREFNRVAFHHAVAREWTWPVTQASRVTRGELVKLVEDELIKVRDMDDTMVSRLHRFTEKLFTNMDAEQRQRSFTTTAVYSQTGVGLERWVTAFRTELELRGIA